MIHLWKRDTPLAEDLSRRSSLLLLDYDGTLREIGSDEELPAERRELLRELAAGPLETAVISGRSVAKLKKLVRVKGLTYCGNYGLEMEGAGWSFVHPQAARFGPFLAAAGERLRRALADLPGLRVERKKWGLGVDGRSVPSRRRRELESRLDRLSREKELSAELSWFKTQEAWELLPRISWGKGDAALLLQRRFNRSFLAAIGDGAPDEDMFRAVQWMGCGIRVGRLESSLAPYWLKDVPEVYVFLASLTRAEQRVQRA